MSKCLLISVSEVAYVWFLEFLGLASMIYLVLVEYFKKQILIKYK